MEPSGVFGGVNGDVYPHVRNFTKAMLELPVISVANERVFCTAGNVIRSQRACLLPEIAIMLIFIKHNKLFYYIFK